MSPDRLDMEIGDRRTERPPTQEVAAATSCRATNPASLVDSHLPLVEGIVLQGIRCEVADLHFVKMGLEVFECHPEMEGRMHHQHHGDDTSCRCSQPPNPLPGEGGYPQGPSQKEKDREKGRGKREGDEERKEKGGWLLDTRDLIASKNGKDDITRTPRHQEWSVPDASAPPGSQSATRES